MFTLSNRLDKIIIVVVFPTV